MKREMELGSHSELDSFLLQVSTAGLSDSLFVTLFAQLLKEQGAEYTSCFAPP